MERVAQPLGLPADQAAETVADVRRRDKERLALQVVSGIQAGRSLLRGNMTTPMPEHLTPRRAVQPSEPTLPD